MTNSNKQTELKSTEEINFQMRRSFSWDRAFFTSDGFLGAEELSNMIQGGGDELQKLEEIESMEAKLFQEIEASTQKSTKTSKITTNSSLSLSSGKRDPQAKKVTGHKDAPIKTPPRRSGGSPGNNAKTVARRSMSSKTGKGNADSPSKTPPTTRNKEVSVNTRVSRTSPASPVSPGSPGSSSSAFAVNQRSKTSVTRRSSVGNEKPSATVARKPAVSLMPKTQSCITLKIKPPPVISHPSSPSRQPESKSRGTKGSSTVHHISKPTSRNYHTGQTSPNAKTVAAANKGLKPISVKTTKPKKQSRETENIFVISPELLDLKGKINALKMEICMQKKDRCNRMAARAAGNLKTPFAMEACSL